MPLTPKQQRFVEEYLIDLNGTQAAIRAGYSPKTAKEQASENLAKPNIQEAIQGAQSARSERTEVNQDYVVQRLKGEAELTGQGSSHSARVRALELLGKHVSMFGDEKQIGVKARLIIEEVIVDASGRAEEGPATSGTSGLLPK